MKKTIIVLLLFAVTVFAQAKNVNIIMSDGSIKQGEFLGQDKFSIFIKNSEGKAETVKTNTVTKAFDSESGEELKFDAVKPASKTEERVKKHIEAAKKLAASVNSQETAVTQEQSAGAPEVKIHGEKYVIMDRGVISPKQRSIFERTIPKYLGFGFSPYETVNILFSGDNTRLKQSLKSYAVDSGGYTYDDSTLMISIGMNMNFFIRPFDWFAFGGFYGLNPSNENLSVHRGYSSYSRFMYIDMPTTQYGALIKFIPYSEANIGADGALVETFAVGFDLKLGAASLGSIFGKASINDEMNSNSSTDLTAEPAPYFAVEFVISSMENCMQFSLGYQQCMFNDITSGKQFSGITDPQYYLADAQGHIPFSAQGLYLSMSIVFN